MSAIPYAAPPKTADMTQWQLGSSPHQALRMAIRLPSFQRHGNWKGELEYAAQHPTIPPDHLMQIVVFSDPTSSFISAADVNMSFRKYCVMERGAMAFTKVALRS